MEFIECGVQGQAQHYRVTALDAEGEIDLWTIAVDHTSINGCFLRLVVGLWFVLVIIAVVFDLD